MPKFGKLTPGHVTGAWKFWKSVSEMSAAEIEREAERPVRIALVGPPDHTALLAARLARETPDPQDTKAGPADIGPYVVKVLTAVDAPEGGIVLHADPLTAGEGALAAALAQVVADLPALRLTLARRVPAFRPAVAARLIQEASWNNAKIALASALPGIVPFLGLLAPAASLGDMVLLTKNQGMLLLRIAAAYGLPVDLKARAKELLPVAGGAFGWRAVARELVGLVPGGIGFAVKGAVAYAGTYTVGRAAALYYSTGQTLSGPRLQRMYRDALGEALAQIRRRVGRGKPVPEDSSDLVDKP